MKKFQKILDSFSLQENLNPKVWDNFEDVEKATLKPEIRKKLLEIAEEFSDDLGEDVFIEDIVLMGSLANYNWSEFSDFDLHLLIDFGKYGEDEELYREIFELKKKEFNNKYNITIYGYDVEVYAQGADDEHSSSAVYSIMNDEWIQKPIKENAEIDFEFLKKKVKSWISKIDDTIETEDIDKMKSLKEKIKKYRKSGLEKEGEFSYENLVFKFLRRSDMIGKLFEAITKAKDKKLSIESTITEQSQSDKLFGSAEVKIPTDGAHAGQSGWASGNAWDIKAPIGEPVYAIADGTVKTFKDYGPVVRKTQGKKLFGIGFTVKSDGSLPDVYYTHLQNAQVQKGSRVTCGQLLGYVMDFPGSSYDHVHIGVEYGHNIREFLNDDGTLKCAKGDLKQPKSKQKKQSNKDQQMVWNTLSDSVFLKKIMSYVKDGLYFEYTPGQKIPYEQPVEVIQSGLQFLGFSLPRYGVDGKFGPETQGAVRDFQSSVGLPQTGIFGVEDSKYLLAMLIQKGFTDSDLRGLQYDRDFGLESKNDQDFYQTLLNKLGAPVTNENMKFLLAWRQAEGKGGDFNPFNTTHKLENSTDFNSAGVQNFQTLDDGMYATLRTLTNGRYNCIVNGLINDIGAAEIAKCTSLKTWGTGDLVGKVIAGYENGAEIKSPSLR